MDDLNPDPPVGQPPITPGVPNPAGPLKKDGVPPPVPADQPTE